MVFKQFFAPFLMSFRIMFLVVTSFLPIATNIHLDNKAKFVSAYTYS